MLYSLVPTVSRPVRNRASVASYLHALRRTANAIVRVPHCRFCSLAWLNTPDADICAYVLVQEDFLLPTLSSLGNRLSYERGLAASSAPLPEDYP